MKKQIPIAEYQKALLLWYAKNHRALPWRADKNPYFIWISEVMLQQTTVQAVVPYFQKFTQRFPDVQALAQAPESEVLAHWAGLGYYSRARNLHRAAQLLTEKGFPKSYKELLELPGIGPYTSRAISSIAFSERVGVLDGNVNRVLNRLLGHKKIWWSQTHQKKLQGLVDELANTPRVAELNQALMELGATICTPQKPTCVTCPLNFACKAHENQTWHLIPTPRPRPQKQLWLWSVHLVRDAKNRLGLIKNDQSPFLKNTWVFPGVFKEVKTKPKRYHFKHGITKYEIFVYLQSGPGQKIHKWTQEEDLSKLNPSSLLQKILDYDAKNNT